MILHDLSAILFTVNYRRTYTLPQIAAHRCIYAGTYVSRTQFEIYVRVDGEK